MDEYRAKIRREDEEALAAAYAKESELRKQIWNEAIEAAAEVVETNGEARHVRDLKK